MSAPRVTVAIPFYNEERSLAAAVRSILAQTFTDFELLLVDDGSTDASLAVARSFVDTRVVVISETKRAHLGARLNQVVRRARGSFVARMDADDLAHPRRLATQLAVLDQDASCDAVGTWAALVDKESAILAVVDFEEQPSDPRVALQTGLMVHATMVARRSWLLAHPYDERFTRAEDRDLWCRVVRTSKIVVVPEVLYVQRVATRGRDFLRDYLESQRQNRQLYALYGPATIGVVESVRQRVLSLAKGYVMTIAVASGVADGLVKRRGRTPTAIERTLVEEALAAQRE